LSLNSVPFLSTVSSQKFKVENSAQPEVFRNAFSGVWWAIATLTTVGYGDIYPITAIGKILASIIALLGIGLVAVPTAIITSGFIEQIQLRRQKKTDTPDFLYCPHCGKRIQNQKIHFIHILRITKNNGNLAVIQLMLCVRKTQRNS